MSEPKLQPPKMLGPRSWCRERGDDRDLRRRSGVIRRVGLCTVFRKETQEDAESCKESDSHCDCVRVPSGDCQLRSKLFDRVQKERHEPASHHNALFSSRSSEKRHTKPKHEPVEDSVRCPKRPAMHTKEQCQEPAGTLCRIKNGFTDRQRCHEAGQDYSHRCGGSAGNERLIGRLLGHTVKIEESYSRPADMQSACLKLGASRCQPRFK